MELIRSWHDGQGKRRVHRSMVDGNRSLVTYPADELTSVDGERTVHVFFGDERVASHQPRKSGHYGEASWYHQDYLGSTNFVSNKYAEVQSQVEYFPSGEPWYEHRVGEYELKAPSFLFTGKEYERSTGLYAFGFRHYDPVVGQWISPDPAMVEYFTTDLAGGVLEPRNLGTYSYAWNNPVGAKDPNGEFIETALDIASFAMGVASLRKNIKEGNVAAAIVDGVGVVLDGAAVVLPGVPGGAGMGVRALRGADRAKDALRQADRVADLARDVDHAGDVGKALKCFAGGTLVKTKSGLREIEEIRKGDWVWAKDEVSGEEGWYPVRRVFRRHGQSLLAMEFSDGEGLVQRLKVTPEHPFWSQDKGDWVEAQDLTFGEWVSSLYGGLRLASVKTLPECHTVYNFEVEGAHSYFVGEAGVWVHNTCGPRTGRGKNRLRADSSATGAHTTFKRGSDSNVSNYATYQVNPRNPSGFQEMKRVDIKGKAHRNPDGEIVPTPHVKEANSKYVRPTRPDEL